MSTLTVSAPARLNLARRMSRLGTETAFEVLVRARALEKQGKHIVHLEIGEPDFDTPKNIVEAAVDALHMGYTHYGPSAGLPDLREAIADDVSKSRGVKFTPDEVVVVPGGKPIIFFTMLALVEEEPYDSIAEALGISVSAVKVRVFRGVRILRKELTAAGVHP